MFDVTDGANAAGFSYVRVPLGASDFSANSMFHYRDMNYSYLTRPIPVSL
jgi:hypothetical protein